MAGDWIKIEHVTPDKPEVHAIASSLNIDPDAVVGKLVRLWIWADQQTVVGNAPSVTDALLDRITLTPGFANAMRLTGWLANKKGAVIFPNFDRHNGKTAKQRAHTGKRVKEFRNAASVTNALPEKRREEERREEKMENCVLPTPGQFVPEDEIPSEVSPALLARQWCFVCTRRFGGRSKDDERDMAGEFANLAALGIPCDAMLVEVKLAPPARDRGEHFWQFKKRMMERFGIADSGKPKAAKMSFEERVAASQRTEPA